MKLRLKGNTLRLRLNQSEVAQLAEGAILRETLHFPQGQSLSYTLSAGAHAAATFTANVIQVAAPRDDLSAWANGEDIGLYFDVPVTPEPLRISVEKDLECVDGPPEERDLDAFPRSLTHQPVGKNC